VQPRFRAYGLATQMTEEKRAFDRIEIDYSIRIIGEDGSNAPAIATNISMTGMQILCDTPTMQVITPHGVETKPDQEVMVHVRVLLTDMPSHESTLGLFARVVVVRATGPDEYRIGIHFTDYEPGSYDALEHYIDAHM
jgi:hypothetical protein